MNLGQGDQPVGAEHHEQGGNGRAHVVSPAG